MTEHEKETIKPGDLVCYKPLLLRNDFDTMLVLEVMRYEYLTKVKVLDRGTVITWSALVFEMVQVL